MFSVLDFAVQQAVTTAELSVQYQNFRFLLYSAAIGDDVTYADLFQSDGFLT